MTILEKIKFEEDWLSEVNLTKENMKIALEGIRATVREQQPCEDCISRQAVIRLVEQYPNIIGNRCSGLIADIKHLPSVNPSYNSVKTELKPRTNLAETSQDTISREALRQKLQDHHDFFVNAYGNFRGMSLNDKARVDEIDNCIAMVVNAPSVTPQPKVTGSWVEKQVVDNEEVEIEQWQSARCSKCDKYHTTPYSYYFDDYNYCPNCGVKMEVEDDDMVKGFN